MDVFHIQQLNRPHRQQTIEPAYITHMNLSLLVFIRSSVPSVRIVGEFESYSQPKSHVHCVQ